MGEQKEAGGLKKAIVGLRPGEGEGGRVDALESFGKRRKKERAHRGC